MRIAIVVSCPQNRKKGMDFARELGKNFEAHGHQAEVVEALRGESKRLSGCQYLVGVASPEGFFRGRLDKRLSDYLKGAGNLQGVRACAIVLKYGFCKNRSERSLMRLLEHEGMIVNYSDFISASTEAARVAKTVLEG